LLELLLVELREADGLLELLDELRRELLADGLLELLLLELRGADGLLELLLLELLFLEPLLLELLADGLLELLLLELLLLLAEARLEPVEDLRLEPAEDLLPEDLLAELRLPLVSPASARCLFTVRAAISSARPFWPRFS
jgi:hypothetical protein